MPKVDWAAAEELLVREGVARFPEIAAKHPDEEFYGVFFDCDVVYTCAQAHMNTNALLRRHAEDCQSGRRSSSAQPLYPGLTIEQVMEELRWDGGGWGHFGIFPGPDFKEIAAAHKALYEAGGAAHAENALKDDFMLMACNAVVRIERCGVLDLFRRTRDFRVLCVYIQESVEDGDRRLQQARRSLGRT